MMIEKFLKKIKISICDITHACMHKTHISTPSMRKDGERERQGDVG